MSAFYMNREKKKRPGVYQQIVNIGKIFDKKAPSGGGTPGGGGSDLKSIYDEDTDTLSLIGKGLKVTYDGAGTVTIAGIRHSYDEGTLTLGG